MILFFVVVVVVVVFSERQWYLSCNSVLDMMTEVRIKRAFVFMKFFVGGWVFFFVVMKFVLSKKKIFFVVDLPYHRHMMLHEISREGSTFFCRFFFVPVFDSLHFQRKLFCLGRRCCWGMMMMLCCYIAAAPPRVRGRFWR